MAYKRLSSCVKFYVGYILRNQFQFAKNKSSENL